MAGNGEKTKQQPMRPILTVIAESLTSILVGTVGGAMSGEREGRAIYLVDRRKCREWG